MKQPTIYTATTTTTTCIKQSFLTTLCPASASFNQPVKQSAALAHLLVTYTRITTNTSRPYLEALS